MQTNGNGGNGKRQEGQADVYRQRQGVLTLYHPNSKGTGSALQLELRMNRSDEERYDCFFLEMALQKTVATGGREARTPATFDWARKATVKLDFLDVCEMLTVLEGKCEQAGGQRNGIYHESGDTNTIISFKRNAETPGYCLGLSRKDRQGNQVFKGHIVLSEAEAIGLRCIFQSALFFMHFNASLQAAAEPSWIMRMAEKRQTPAPQS
jgi:hypothetical protein